MNFPEARNLLQKAKEAAIAAGVYDRMFIAFGTMLGAIRPTKRKDGRYYRGFMEHDHDMDIALLPMSPDEKEKFFQECEKRGIWRHRIQRVDVQGIVWFKLKISGASSCVWFLFGFDQYLFHSKGNLWLKPDKFRHFDSMTIRTARGMALGAPAKFFTPLTEIDFEGMKMNVPLQAGSLCDHWYTGWHTPKGGSSEKKAVLRIGNWKDKSTWRII